MLLCVAPSTLATSDGSSAHLSLAVCTIATGAKPPDRHHPIPSLLELGDVCFGNPGCGRLCVFASAFLSDSARTVQYPVNSLAQRSAT